MSKITLQEEAGTPTTPATGKWRVYFKAGGLYVIDDAGNEVGPLFSDAPSDGTQYARKDAAWEAVAASGGDGWTAYSTVVPTLTTSDDPTYTLQFAGVDLTGILCEAMPIKWTQNSIVRYGWISSAPAFSTNTTITVLTRCNDASADYDVLNTTTYPITGFSYGLPKQPGFGMPVDRSKWTIETTQSADAAKASPAANTWYGDTGLSATGPSISIPIGAFLVYYECSFYCGNNGTIARVYGSLSTSASSESDSDFTAGAETDGATSAGLYTFAVAFRRKNLVLASKTTYYLIVKTHLAAASVVGIWGSVSKTIIRAECAYL